LTPLRLVLRSAVHHWRAHLAVALGVVVAAAVLTGSLVVGDSVRHSLRAQALVRLGWVRHALAPPGRFVRQDLVERLSRQQGDQVRLAPLLVLRGVGADADGTRRANRVQVMGVDHRFFAAESAGGPTLAALRGGVVLNRVLAAALGVKVADNVLLRVEKPGVLPRDVPLSAAAESTVVVRLPVTAIIGPDQLGDFALGADAIAPANAFVDLATLQRRAGLDGLINLAVWSSGPSADQGGADELTVERLTRDLRATWTPADSQIEIRDLPTQQAVEVRTARIFLDPATVTAVGRAAGVLTYFVNELRVGGRAAPYSMVAAGDWAGMPAAAPIPGDLADDEVAINTWLADDLKAKTGDALTVKFWALGATGGLIEQSASFRVRAVVPVSGLAADRELMPQFPGIADADHCRDWKPGLPVDVDRIRDQDETWWEQHRGTPKAFISLAAGEKLWRNRFGERTALRLPRVDGAAAAVAQRLADGLDPTALGLVITDVRAHALAASGRAMDFGGLFLGLGCFLIVAALVLAGLLMALGLDRRRREVGILLAIGLRPALVGRLLLCEVALAVMVASAVGAVVGGWYARAIIAVLAGQWAGAVGGAPVQYHATTTSFAIGVLATVVLAVLVLWRGTRRLGRERVRALLAGSDAARPGNVSTLRRWFRRSGPVLIIAGALIGLLSDPHRGGMAVAGAYFAAGALALGGLIAVIDQLLARLAGRGLPVWSLFGLAVSNLARRPGRSLAVVGMLACASFLVLSIGAFRRDPLANATRRDSGTGGFALVTETTLPVAGDLAALVDRQRLGLDVPALKDAAFIGLRANQGDDASCLNLYHSPLPRLVGVDPARLAALSAFAFAAHAPLPAAGASPWTLLARDAARPLAGDAPVPAIADQATLQWSLGLGLGGELDYRDEHDRAFRLRIVGVLADSVMQGNLIIDEGVLAARFPSQGGYRLLLVDVPAASTDLAAAAIDNALADYGSRSLRATDRLAAFLAVERTYLDIFQTLGGLALLLGSFGVGVLVLRGVLERRGELAALRAIGFRGSALRRLLIGEHLVLLALGLVAGVVAGLVAVYPALLAPTAQTPWRLLGATAAAIVVSGVGWIGLSTWWALRGDALASLRSE